MTRRMRPGSVQAAVRAVFRAVGGLENAAADTGAAISTLSVGTEVNEARPGGLGVNYLDRLGRIDPAAALPMAEHFAQLAGGVFVPVDLGGVAAAEFAGVAKEFADVVNAHVAATSEASTDPARYTTAEVQDQARELLELAAVTMKMRAVLLAGAEGRG
jgi:hypothetical protein